MADHGFISENIVFLCLFLLIALMVSQLLHKHNVMWLPASGAQIILGFIIGAGVFFFSTSEADFLMFRSDFFFFALLPPIVHEAGYSMKRANFFKNIGSILLFAFIGTFISTFVVGLGLYGLANAHVVDLDHSNPLDSLTFGALISSIDPVATLAILGNKKLRCDPMLYALVFGESVFNDAVAITLFQTFSSFAGKTNFTPADYFAAIGQFTLICLGSLALGAVVALLCAFMLRKIDFSHSPSNEFLVIFLSAYLCYCLAEWTHMSGIMALFICGIMQAHYSWYNITPTSRTTTRNAFHSFAHLAEAILYIYLGVSGFFATQSHFNFQWSISLIIAAPVLSILGRALNIFPLAFLANMGRSHKISFKMQVVMWFAGLRGAISFALVLSMDQAMENTKKFVTATMVIIVASTLLMGGTSNWLLNQLSMTGMAEEDADDHDHHLEERVSLPSIDDHIEEHIEEHAKFIKSGCIDLHDVWVNFDTKYMQPLFGGRHAPKISHTPRGETDVTGLEPDEVNIPDDDSYGAYIHPDDSKTHKVHDFPESPSSIDGNDISDRERIVLKSDSSIDISLEEMGSRQKNSTNSA